MGRKLSWRCNVIRFCFASLVGNSSHRAQNNPFASLWNRTKQNTEPAEINSYWINQKGVTFESLRSSTTRRNLCLHSLSEMADQQVASKSWILEAAPYFAVLLIAAHVFAMVFWMYKLATEKPRDKRSQRWKSH